MPELPEVEVVRRGLAEHLTGRTIDDVAVRHPRAVRRCAEPCDVANRLDGARVRAVERRGKFLWLDLDGVADDCLLVHLGMSGQMLIKPAGTGAEDPNHTHLRIRARVGGADGRELWFVDQRTFGYWWPCALALGKAGRAVPEPVAHIGADLLEDAFDAHAVAALMKTKRTEIKRLLLNQEILSGIGNIYADEMLFAARIHPRQRADRVALPRLVELLDAGRAVMERALEQGGTSFDSLYVNVNGRSGYFSRSLNVYGRAGRPCPRCGTPVIRETFMNRSSHLCPTCQRRH